MLRACPMSCGLPLGTEAGSEFLYEPFSHTACLLCFCSFSCIDQGYLSLRLEKNNNSRERHEQWTLMPDQSDMGNSNTTIFSWPWLSFSPLSNRPLFAIIFLSGPNTPGTPGVCTTGGNARYRRRPAARYLIAGTATTKPRSGPRTVSSEFCMFRACSNRIHRYR